MQMALILFQVTIPHAYYVMPIILQYNPQFNFIHGIQAHLQE